MWIIHFSSASPIITQSEVSNTPRAFENTVKIEENEVCQTRSLTHYQMTNFRLFQTEKVCNFKFDKNGTKLSKQVENTVGKGEIAHYEQFLHFPQCFQKACFPGASKDAIVWEWVKT